MEKCALCGAVIQSKSYASSLYCPDVQYILCPFCGKQEEKAIDEAGTNNIPKLLSLYIF